MMGYANLREAAFWALDILKGKPVGSFLEDIDCVFTNSNLKEVEQKLKYRLDKLIAHACSTTEFYKKYDKSDINNFPVIDKTMIKEKFSEFRSNLFPDIAKLSPMITSGSTGTPFKIFHDKGKRQRNWADTIYFSDKAGYTLGEKLYYLKIWSLNNKKSSIQEWMQNIVPIDVLNLKKNSRSILEKINQENTKVNFLGYSSALETLCKVLDNEPDLAPKIKINSIITMSESLDDYTKSKTEQYFSCPALSRYSNIENGILAQQTLSNQNDFTVNIASYMIEIFDIHRDVPLSLGQLGRIVVTDYFNYATPLIRYDTGDIGQLEEKIEEGVKKLFLTKVEGRKLDQIFNTNGELISSYIVYKNMWKYTEIDQYQLVQKTKNEYLFKICTTKNF